MSKKKTESSGVTRRDFLKAAGAGTVAGCLGGVTGALGIRGPRKAFGSVPDIKIACVYPLSGAYSRNGNLTVQGIKAGNGVGE